MAEKAQKEATSGFQMETRTFVKTLKLKQSKYFHFFKEGRGFLKKD